MSDVAAPDPASFSQSPTRPASAAILYSIARIYQIVGPRSFRLILIAFMGLVWLVGCSSSRPSLAQALVGTWANTDGYRIEFHPDGTGYIPGVANKIPSENFTYSLSDESHVLIRMEGVQYSIGIQITGDQLTWKDELGEVQYKRVK